MEAYSSGIPVITTPFIPKSLQHSNSFSIVPFDDIDALFNAMKLLVESPKDCYDASLFIEQNYSNRQLAKRLTTVFQSIIKP